jgi:hypothetical protein
MTPRVSLLHSDELTAEARSAYEASYDAFTTGTVLKGVVDSNTACLKQRVLSRGRSSERSSIGRGVRGEA